MGRKPNSPSSSIDWNSTLSEILWGHISKHRTCWLHLAAYLYRRDKKITLKELEEIRETYRRKSPCLYRYLPQRLRRERSKRSKGITNHGIITCAERKKLNTGAFEHYMESLWRSFSEDKRMPFAYFDSLWFSMYRKASTKRKVLSWIKQKDIFSKKYVFVPIVCWNHWSLLIFVHLGESLDSVTKTPCMLLLDSLEIADPKRLEPEIRKFVADIYRAEGRTEDKKVISRIPFLVPKVPQQRNDEECGSFVLYFINLFMKAAPENFSISEGYPYFMKKDWFTPKGFECFRSKLEKEQPEKLPQTNKPRITLRMSRRRQVGLISIDDD